MNDGIEPDARCGYPTKSGSPCRNRVDRPGKPCRMHAKAALLDRLLGRRSADQGEATASEAAGGATTEATGSATAEATAEATGDAGEERAEADE